MSLHRSTRTSAGNEVADSPSLTLAMDTDAEASEVADSSSPLADASFSLRASFRSQWFRARFGWPGSAGLVRAR